MELLPSPDGWTLTKAHLKVALRKVVSYRRIHIHFLKWKLDRQILQQTKFYLTKRRYCVVINYFFNAKQHHNSIKKLFMCLLYA